MGYGMQIPAHRVGGPKKLWDFRVYGLSESWVKRVLTVVVHESSGSATTPGQATLVANKKKKRARMCEDR